MTVLTRTRNSGGSGAERAAIPLTAGCSIQVVAVHQTAGGSASLLGIVLAYLLVILLNLQALLQLLQVGVVAVAGGGCGDGGSGVGSVGGR